MSPNRDIPEHYITWYKGVFGFTACPTIALYDVQMLKDKETLSELDNSTVVNICKAVS
jgi:hypothetical protein